ncbi:homoserine kinase [Candidatus Albibeggiatoa sp. nov. NOAA]|uniref:homoserine kinase n=1 Tax=Candidatus Albibeggiatoa sp. nov. NOAA TaxID=3162724 RepID=UPI0032F48627|nr:homoserine kinase [Thiotrichaceae bacterium]
MSVYTVVSQAELEAFLTQYNLGKLVDFKGISEGIENTNYFVTTTQGEFVLTLFEQHTADELPFFLELMAYLAEHEIPSAHPLADKENHYLRELNGKPAALVRRLAGKSVLTPNLTQCCEIGCALGQFHAVSPEFNYSRENGRGLKWWQATSQRVMSQLSAEDAALLKNEVDFQLQHKDLDLPGGVTHADLFCDNALFQGDRLSGILDFYFACNDSFLFDVAVTVNAWCTLEDSSLDEKRVEAVLKGYTKHRGLTTEEKQAWPAMLRAAALRFWLSRLQDKLFPREGEMTQVKDPDEYKNILKNRLTVAALS